jgi:hypothetical protein
MGLTVGERCWKILFFLCLAWRLRRSVWTFSVRGNTISGGVLRCHRVPVFEEHRHPMTGSRCDIRWLSGRGKTPTFSVFPVFCVAVMEKICDACGDGEYYFRSDFFVVRRCN